LALVGKAYMAFQLNRSLKNSVILMKKNTIYIIVAVLVIVIIIAGAAAYLLTNNGGSGTTPTPTPSATPVPTVIGASTLQFNVNQTGTAGTVTYMFSAKNLNTTTLIVRMDILGGSAGNYSYIVDTSAQKAYSNINNAATWTSDDWPTDYAMVITPFNDYVTHLADNWNGSDLTYTYTSTTGTILIYSICPNPTLTTSLFATS
jgi:hypothetical protein